MQLLDNAFLIFNNMPTRLDWVESDIQLPAEQEDFSARTWEEACLCSRTFRPKMGVREAFQKLFVPPKNGADALLPLRKGVLNVLDLQMLIHREPFFPYPKFQTDNDRSIYMYMEANLRLSTLAHPC
jgi:hypothetical protein